MDFQEMQAKARRVRARYADMETARYGRAWTSEEMLHPPPRGPSGDLPRGGLTDSPHGTVRSSPARA